MNEKKPIRFTEHAELKTEILKNHGFKVSEEFINSTIYEADRIEWTYKGRRVAQKVIGENHVLRVIFEEHPEEIVVITLYPGRRERYEKS